MRGSAHGAIVPRWCLACLIFENSLKWKQKLSKFEALALKRTMDRSLDGPCHL